MKSINQASSLSQVQNLLPSSIKDIVEIIGIKSTQNLVQKFGGITLDIPKKIDNSYYAKALVSAIGESQTKTLIKIFGGEQMYIARCHDALKQLNYVSFLEELDTLKKEGISQKKAFLRLLLKYNFSERTAYKLLANQKNEKQSQKTLF